MSSLLKSVAVAAGAGIVFGLCATAATRRAAQREPESPRAGNLLPLEPLLDRLERIETRLEAEFTNRIDQQETELLALRARVVEAAEKVEKRVAERIGPLDRALAQQSALTGALRDRAQETDSHLQRLIAAVERLCATTPERSATVLPFEAHLAEAAAREPAAEPRVKVIKGFPLARTFVFVLAILLPRLHQ